MKRPGIIRNAVAAIGAIGVTAMLAADPAWAPSASVETGSEIIEAISVVSDGSALFFGAFEPGAGGTVVVTQAGAGSTTGGVVFVPAGNQTTAAGFDVAGEPGFGYHLGGGDVSVTLFGPGGATLTASLDKPAGGVLDGVTGTDSFSVGGELTVGPSLTQPFGEYVGSFSITVFYD